MAPMMEVLGTRISVKHLCLTGTPRGPIKTRLPWDGPPALYILDDVCDISVIINPNIRDVL